MSMQDPIADLLTQIRNGFSAKKYKIIVHFSVIKRNILEVLKEEGYIVDYIINKLNYGNLPQLEITLKYFENASVISSINRHSKPGMRIYKSTSKLPYIQGGLGIAIISTSKGVMSDRRARELNLGGEVLCTVT